MNLSGRVTNVVDFGAFVDIGVGKVSVRKKDLGFLDLNAGLREVRIYVPSGPHVLAPSSFFF